MFFFLFISYNLTSLTRPHFEKNWRKSAAIFLAGWGTDEKAIISIMGHRNAVQRKLIRQAYEETYQEDLIKRLESELSGHFEVILLVNQ